MYDTVAAVLGEVPPTALDPKRWQRSRSTVDHATGEVVQTMTSNTGGLLLTLHGARAIKAERSLPKVYRGENVTDLHGPAVSVALAMMDAEIGDVLGYDIPPVAAWLPVRSDYPRSIDCGDEAGVMRTLAKLAGLEMPYKGRPVVGQSHSVTWSKGDIRLKAYSKHAETKGDPRALGLLRVEPGVFRARTFRRLLGRASDADVSLLDVLTADMHERVNDKFRARLEGDMMTAQEIGDLDLFREMLAIFGARRSASLLGWAAMFGLTGVESRTDMLNSSLGSPATRYRVLADFRELRRALIAKGYTLSETGDETHDVEEVVHRLSGLAA
jgi:hypothetical protein